MGDLEVSDLIDENVQMVGHGPRVTVTGTIKAISEAWTAFDPRDGYNTGHFFPIQLPADCSNQKITCKNRVDGDRTVTIDPDLLLIIRLENLEDEKAVLEKDDELLMTIDFSGATLEVPIGKKAVSSAVDQDFGKYGSATDFCRNVDISWNGTKGAVTGDFYRKNKAGGYILPMKIADYYTDEEIMVTDLEADSQLWLVELSGDTSEVITVERDGNTLAKLSFTEAQFHDDAAPGVDPVGEGYVVIADQDEDMDAVKPASELIKDDVQIAWTGIKGLVSGAVHWYKFTNGHFSSTPTGHFLPVVVVGHAGETIKVTGSDDGETSLVDPKWNIRVDDFITASKTCKMYAGEKQLCELDFSGLTLETPKGENAFVEEQTHGEFGTPEDMYEGVERTWKNTKCVVTGTLKKLSKEKYPKIAEDGAYYFGFTLAKDFIGKKIEVRGPSGYEVQKDPATAENLDWVVQIKQENIAQPIFVYINDHVLASFDLSGVKLAE